MNIVLFIAQAGLLLGAPVRLPQKYQGKVCKKSRL